MDYDLFGLDEVDDELLSTINQFEATQQNQQTEVSTHEVLPEFVCNGEDSLRSQFTAMSSFIKNAFFNSQPNNSNINSGDITISDYDFHANHLLSSSVAEFVIGQASMNIQRIGSSFCKSINDKKSPSGRISYYQLRRQVTLTYHLILRSTYIINWPLLEPLVTRLRRLLNRLSDLDGWKLVYFANSSKGNECTSSVYHFLHGALEWKLLDLCVLKRLDEDTDSVINSTSSVIAESSFKAQLERVFDDLLTCSLLLFSKKSSLDLVFSSPFPCTCFKEFWLLLQLAFAKWSETLAGERKLYFWKYFNESIVRAEARLDRFGISAQRFYEFTNWIHSALIRLQGYRSNGQYEGPHYKRATHEDAENYEFCEKYTQKFLNSNPTEQQLRVYICLLTPTLLEWWRPRVNIPMILWEYFYKRLNSSFYVAGAAPIQLAVTYDSGRAYLEKYRLLLKNCTPDPNLSSYTLFTVLLGNMLSRLMKDRLNNPMQKLLGRIYTKFSVQKFLALNDTGMHHLLELFLILGLSGDDNDITSKLRDKLLSIPSEELSASNKIAIAKGHMALLILFAEHGCDLDDYISKCLQQLAGVRNDQPVARVLVDGFLDIIKHSNDFTRGEHMLIGEWLPNYLSNCNPSEMNRVLEAIHSIFEKLNRNELLMETNDDLIKAINVHIFPFVKQHYVSDCSRYLPELAADFCIHPGFVSDRENFDRLFTYFVEAQTANASTVAHFLLRILESSRRPIVDETIVLHVWLKSLVLLTSNNEFVKELTKFVIELPAFRAITKVERNEMLNAKEPLWLFISAVGKNYDACNDFGQRCTIADNLNAYLRNFEKWLPADWSQEPLETVSRYFSFIAIVIYNCPKIVYVKSKITCFFHVAITRFVLPTNVLMGKSPEPRLAQVVHKIWPVLVQGIGRLSFKSDPYLSKTLIDLIQKWTPKFKISTQSRVVAQPYLLCLQSGNHELSLFVFEKLASIFLTTQRRQPDANACLVITIFQEVIETLTSSSTSSDNGGEAVLEQRFEEFLKATCLHMLEHMLMVDEVMSSKGLLNELFKSIILSRTYKNSPGLKELLAEHLRLIIKKHLAYHTIFCFELLIYFAKISHVLIEDVMSFVVTEMRIVEEKRGLNDDNHMRKTLEKLQNVVLAEKQRKN